MPIDDTAMAAAINTGIAAAAPSPAPAAAAPDTSTATGGDDNADQGSDGVQDAAGEGEQAPAGDSAGESGADGNDDGAGGTSGEGEPAAAGEGDTAAGAPGAAAKKPAEGAESAKAGAGKEPDPLNDPLPNALKKETKERIHTLVGMVKKGTERYEALERDHNDVMGVIRESTATPQQYSQALDYIRLVNSPRREDKERALTVMQAEMNALARMLGKPLPGVNLLEGHDDLIADVGAGRMTMERASELAAARERVKYEGQVATANSNQQAAAERRQREVGAGVKALNAVEARLTRDDPNYAAKRPILIRQLKPVLSRLPPSEWAATFQNAYDALPIMAPRQATPAAPAGGTPPNVPKNTPLSARQPAGGAAPAPKSLEEAIMGGVAAAAGR